MNLDRTVVHYDASDRGEVLAERGSNVVAAVSIKGDWRATCAVLLYALREPELTTPSPAVTPKETSGARIAKPP